MLRRAVSLRLDYGESVRIVELMEPVLGDWQGRELLQLQPGSPAVAARAALRFKAEAGGAVVVQDYRQAREDGTEFFGHGVFMAVEQAVWWWFFDSSGSAPRPALGGWAEEELVLCPSGGPALTHRSASTTGTSYAWWSTAPAPTATFRGQVVGT